MRAHTHPWPLSRGEYALNLEPGTLNRTPCQLLLPAFVKGLDCARLLSGQACIPIGRLDRTIEFWTNLEP